MLDQMQPVQSQQLISSKQAAQGWTAKLAALNSNALNMIPRITLIDRDHRHQETRPRALQCSCRRHTGEPVWPAGSWLCRATSSHCLQQLSLTPADA